MPRHPPIALKTLDRSHCQCPSGSLRMPLAQKDQLLEICPGERLGKPIICGRLSVSPRQTRAFNAQSAARSKPAGDRTHAKESEQIFSLRCHTEQAVSLAARCKLVLTNDRKSSRHQIWWSRTGSNRRPPACKAGALPAELRPLIPVERMVGLGGLEPPTSRLSSARSNQLSYKP